MSAFNVLLFKAVFLFFQVLFELCSYSKMCFYVFWSVEYEEIAALLSLRLCAVCCAVCAVCALS